MQNESRSDVHTGFLLGYAKRTYTLYRYTSTDEGASWLNPKAVAATATRDAMDAVMRLLGIDESRVERIPARRKVARHV